MSCAVQDSGPSSSSELSAGVIPPPPNAFPSSEAACRIFKKLPPTAVWAHFTVVVVVMVVYVNVDRNTSAELMYVRRVPYE